MTFNLYLLRHAKSDWSVPGQKDIDRMLNSRGNNDAPRMGRKLHDLNVEPDLMIASPARRTRDTAGYIAEQLQYDLDNICYDEEIYEASVRTLLGLVNKLDDKNKSVMLVGHNPGFSYLAEYLTKEEIGNIPTCGVVNIEFSGSSWLEVSGGTGILKWFIYPKKLNA